MSEGSLDVEIARLDGRLQSAEERLRRTEQDVTKLSEKATSLHGRLDTEVDAVRKEVTGEIRVELKPLRDGIAELREWRASVKGYAAAMATAAGLISGFVVTVLNHVLERGG